MEIEHIFEDIEEYMLSAQNIIKYNKKNYESINNLQKNKKHNNTILSPIKKETIFIPFQKDKLFWSFYIILNGFDAYEFVKNDSFKTEKNFKIQSIEKLRNIKDKLKELKIKRNEIEDELVNSDCITIKGIETLCMLYNVSLMYVAKKKYYEFLFGATETESEGENINIKGIIIETENNEYGIKYECDNIYISNIRTNYWQIESIHKPIRGLSAYTIKDLQDIANKLDVGLLNLDSETLNKKKNKKQLYEEILGKL